MRAECGSCDWHRRDEGFARHTVNTGTGGVPWAVIDDE